MSYFEDFIEPHIGELEDWMYGRNYDDFQYSDTQWLHDGKWYFYEHLSTKHLNAIVGLLTKKKLRVPPHLEIVIDDRVKEMFDEE